MMYTYNDALNVDSLIHSLATYEVSKGYIFVPEDVGQALEYHKSVARRFNYFKKILQNGEMTLEELENKVVEQNGPFPKKKDISIDDLDKVDTCDNKKDDEHEKGYDFQKFLLDFLKYKVEESKRKSDQDESNNN